MRISDWSSDVCSSDLVVGAVAQRRCDTEATHPRADQVVRGCLGGGVGAARVVGRGLGEAEWVAELEVAIDLVGGDVVEPGAVTADRKSVVEGKSVSVRVDLGGRRIVKKNRNEH